MKIGPWLSPLILILGLASCNSDPAPSNSEVPPPVTARPDSLELEEAPQPYFLKKYEGTINGNLPVEMVLVNWGDGFLSGRYWYKDKGQPIELSGELAEDMNFQITEFSNNKETGTFAGALADPSYLSGAWTSASKSKNFTFELHEIPPPADVAAWADNWHLNEVWDNGTLMIGNVSQDSFDFALTIVRGSHTGAIEGRAVISGNKARFSRKEFEEKPCVLLFERIDDRIELKQPSSNFECGFGARAYAGGTYERRNLIKKASLAVGTGEGSVFPTQELHDAFKSLVGEKMYDLFAFNMQQTETEKKQNGRTSVTGAIPGLFRTNEAVIVFDKTGLIWAATLDVDETTNESLVRYFTNDPASKRQLPPEIQSWREGFKDYRLIY
jgi:hypothetical protein